MITQDKVGIGIHH